MRLWEIIGQELERLVEMTFPRNKIIRKLEDLQRTIELYAFKIICMPTNQAVSHWRRELGGYSNDLMQMYLPGKKPMGFDLAYRYLYIQPFGEVELERTEGTIEALRFQYEQEMPETVDANAVHAKFRAFMIDFCTAIGDARPVNTVVSHL